MPAGPGACEYDREAVAAGAFWRPLTAQVVHWSARMTATDLGAVLLLGAVLERRSRRAAVLALACGLALAAAGIHWLPPPVARYRGSSTVASSLYVALALDLGVGTRSPAVRSGAALALVAFLAKAAFEAGTGRALFAGPMPPGVVVLPRAHLLGGLGGAIGWACTAPNAPAGGWPGPRLIGWRAR
jgi:membrane associated rhomboid family serine protease